jgi:DNA gyrase/topoisomerase IV subunit A
MIKEIQRTITEYLDNEYAAYGMYTIENRAIPSAIDGFKPTQRKIIYVANRVWKASNDKPNKVFQFAGRIAADAAYHHGDASLNAAIIGMAQTFKNSMPLLDGIGQFGSLRSPEAGAPRYISTKLNGNFRLLYKDFELLEKQEEEGNEIEPKFFLPIIPTVLLNGSSGIAVGFATNILNRNSIDLIDACIKSLDGKKFNEPLPWWNGFSGRVEKLDSQSSSFIIKGSYDIVNSTTIKITELPPSMTYQKFESHLNSLQEKGHIQYYDDNCTKNEIHYVVKFNRASLAERIKKNTVEALLKLNEAETENITCLDEKGKLIIFKSATELINYFVKFRLSFYDKRKSHILSELKKDLLISMNRAKFIKKIIDNKLKISNRPKSEIVKDLETDKFHKIEESYDYLLNMAIHTLTKEKFEDLLSQIKRINDEVKKTEDLLPINMYKADLLELKKKITK